MLPQVPAQLIAGDLRIQVISPYLVRIEQKGPNGFEDRVTFDIVGRESGFKKLTGKAIQLDGYTVLIPDDDKAADVKIEDTDGKMVYQWDGKPIGHKFLPGPEDRFQSYAIEDTPRIVPPPWGATPPPAGNTLHPEHSGWDLTNDAPDIYVFLKSPKGYEGLREDFLNLTGHTPMPPLAAFGFWDSRYYEYKQQEALDTIDKYRSEGFPIDFFVVDTDWRVNGSHGYDVNTKDFPDMEGFINAAHARHVHLMYNDHPEPVDQNALAPDELAYRWSGLSKLLKWGADVWWYDRNWSTHLTEPAPGIAPEVWGDRLYHDMTEKARPGERPLIMSNVQGIDNGIRNYAPSPAFHRYPIWWTGDTTADWPYLQHGVANGVDSGVISLLPYVNEDLGGHVGVPTPELYVRYLEYGSLAPIMRVHCTKGQDRHPWVFGPEAESIVRNYIRMRYRLLPTLYEAAFETYVTGTPILRRCDLEWPQFPEATADDQYLFGHDILVAPIMDKAADGQTASRSVWIPPGEWEDLWTGRILAGPQTLQVQAPLNEEPMFVRRGGIVLSIPDMDYIGEKPWDQLTVDVYTSGHPDNNHQVLYEDDGHSNGYIKNGSRTTEVTSQESSDGVEVQIIGAHGSYKGAPSERSWELRVHLWPGQTVAAVMVDGKGLSADGYRVLAPEGTPSMPFLGSGSNPPGGSGDVVEVDVPSAQADREHVISVKTRT